jgi:hypothetical protein
VLYFSLAALPLFGIGQYWIPASDVGRRRYVFFLLLVYVAAALSLLVSTSFLNLRRYLRQRRVEMPLPIAGTWVGMGAVLIVLVMLLAALVPRPNAEIALSRVPWQADSPAGLSASRTSVLRDGGEQAGEQQDAQAGTTTGEDEKPADQQQVPQRQQNGGESAEANDASQSMPGEADSKSSEGSAAKPQSGDVDEGSSNDDQNGAQGSEKSNPSEASADRSEKNGDVANASSTGQAPAHGNMKSEEAEDQQSAETSAKPLVSHGDAPVVKFLPQAGGLGGVLKLLFYVVAALVAVFLIWRYRQQLLQAITGILRQLRELFGGRRATFDGESSEGAKATALRPSFTEFRDPFSSGQGGRWAPEELVRYTFAAFEAWANDRGSPRTPDCTPQELVTLVVEPKTPMHDEARYLLRLYSQVAYASQRVSREEAAKLSTFWQSMRSAYHDRRAESA